MQHRKRFSRHSGKVVIAHDTVHCLEIPIDWSAGYYCIGQSNVQPKEFQNWHTTPPARYNFCPYWLGHWVHPTRLVIIHILEKLLAPGDNQKVAMQYA